MYTETPLNYNAIKDYVIDDKPAALSHFSTAGKLFFYDACAFRKHAQISDPTPLFCYFKQGNAVIVITRCILMELSSTGEHLHPHYINYIRSLHQAGINILLIYEEDIFALMEQSFSSTTIINQYLFRAVNAVNHTLSTINTALAADNNLYLDLMVHQTSDRLLYQRFFHATRACKESGDNLGEELLTICTHILANIPFSKQYKYLILTEDRDAIRIISNAAKNSYKHLQQYIFSAITTPRLVQQLHTQGFLTTAEQIAPLLSAGVSSQIIKIFASCKYDLSPREQVVTISELAQKITTSGSIHINY